MKTWLITGGAGFIGSHLVSLLEAVGDAVVVLDNLSTGSLENLSGSNNVQLVTDDIRNNDQLVELARDCDGIFHLAARVSVQGCIESWQEGHAINVVGTINALQAASAHNIPIVYASSAAVYGNQSGLVCHEEMREAPVSPYGADKLACEHQAAAFFYTKALSSIGLRFFNVYGPGQDPSSPYAGVISKFADNARNRRMHTIFGDGLQSRDFIYVEDVVTALYSAMMVLIGSPKPMFDVTNVCTGQRTNLLQIVDIMSMLIGCRDSKLNFAQVRAGDIRDSVGDVNRMQELLSISQTVDVSDGLSRYLKSLAQRP